MITSHFGKPTGSPGPFSLLSLMMIISWVASCSSPDPGSSDRQMGTVDREAASFAPAQELIQKGYEHKRSGENAMALAAFEKACELIGRNSGLDSANYASCLDDRASVFLRLGKMDEAREGFFRAKKILEELKGADPRLLSGIDKRLKMVDIMGTKGFKCAEPEKPPAHSPLPYFPDVVAYQEALGRLNSIASGCKEGVPEVVTLRIIVSGEGMPLRAEVRDHYADTPIGKCVVDRIMAAVPTANLPKFRACFRGFTYPFMVGTHQTKQIDK